MTAWHCIPQQLVSKSFHKCEISNALDGTEDDALWTDDIDNEDFLDSKEDESSEDISDFELSDTGVD